MRRLQRPRRFLAVALGLALAVPGLLAAVAGPASAATRGTVVSTHVTPFGTALVVGSGPFKGFSLYSVTSDNAPRSYGCTTVVIHLMGQTGSCTGPENDKAAIWPALTTTGTPVAGMGVTQSLLGTVKRHGVGTQVTYNGHPLYLFDQAPGMVTGENIDDPATGGLTHGLWDLVAPDGNQLPWAGQLTTVTIGGVPRLAAVENTLAGYVDFPVYVDNQDPNAPAADQASEQLFPALLTGGFPGTSGGASGTLGTSTGLGLGSQITYNGRPLYLYGPTSLNFNTLLAAGNGAGKDGFSLVSP